MESHIIQSWLDPNVALQHGPTVLILIVVIYFYRKDVSKQREDDRADREKERLEHAKQQDALTAAFSTTVQEIRESVREIVATNKSNIEAILSKAEATERLCEERYKIVLEQTLNRKKAS